ncbi:MAG TPA: winged helix-turn-helix domain-containing protein [Candidatus Sulfotelmatobacter sp.]
MAQGFSKKNQSPIETAYRFGDFALYPRDRLLKRGAASIALQPKGFDALLCLVRGAEHMVSKQELRQTLWPDVHVSERNLTNLIVSLRKILGPDAIKTVSKHGYRLELPVSGEPGVRRETYEKFIRARELTTQRSLESMLLARDLYWTCLAQNPNFAPAWAWLGRCCWFLDKFTHSSSVIAELAEGAFQRAFVLDPDLASAHQFYTLLQVDLGRADVAMRRLFERLERHPTEPESFSSLVQVLRFRGLLRESVAAHRRAVELDPAVATSVAHTFFLAGQYKTAIEAYSGRSGYYLDAAAWAALDDRKQAVALLRERLNNASFSTLITALMASLLAILEGKTDKAEGIMDGADTSLEPEILVYFARHYGHMRLLDSSIKALQRAARSGFICASDTLKSDPWLLPLRKHRELGLLLRNADALAGKARSSFAEYGASSKCFC